VVIAKRYRISYGAFGPLLTVLGLGRRFSFVEHIADQLHVQMGWAFRARFPIASVRSVSAYSGVVTGIGVHGFGGNYLVNGKANGIVTLEIEPIARALLLGIPTKLRRLSVSLEDPDQFMADFAPHAD
jgi:hypothetical protein